MIRLTFLFLLFFIGFSEELNNGLGRTPQMGKRKKDSLAKMAYVIIFIIEGWNSWNHFGCRINETVVRQTADTIVATGLAAAGYQYGLFLSYFVDTNHSLFLTISSEYG